MHPLLVEFVAAHTKTRTTLDSKQLLAELWSAVRPLQGKVLGPITRGAYVSNFEFIQLELDSRRSPERFAALLGDHGPFVAFARPFDTGDMTRQFVDLPRVASQLTAGWRICSAAELHSPFELDAPKKGTFPAGWRKEVAYWKPSTLGEFMFNCWD